MFPFRSDEYLWPTWPRGLLYLLVLMYVCVGVAVIADIFMASIERITSRKVRMLNKTKGFYAAVVVWNSTLANLTLMALGSSAPEILLTMIETVGGKFIIGELGPSAVVGAASFNLHIIFAVCVLAIPPSESRRIESLSVYAVTASTSILAYLWLLVMLYWTSPNVIEIWEGVVTLLMYPLMLLIAYAADREHFNCTRSVTEEDHWSDGSELSCSTRSTSSERSYTGRLSRKLNESLTVNGKVEEEESENEESAVNVNGHSKLDYATHYLMLPWKLLFALVVPPVNYCGGWLCFFVSLLVIGALTALLEDTAKLVGCCWGIPIGVIGITFVALGTSLPDTFASRISAIQSSSADSAVGNLTGSNCLNVFLGLGLPWTASAIYWKVHGRDSAWDSLYQNDPDVPQSCLQNGCFVVKAGDIGFNVAVYTATAIPTLSLMAFRRYMYGAELGGGTRLSQTFYALGLFALWVAYVTAAIIYMFRGQS